MRWVGLPGKSFVPLIVGFGCNVPAIMATRTLEHRRDRLMTIAMAPFMSCGAVCRSMCCWRRLLPERRTERCFCGSILSVSHWLFSPG